MKKLIRGGRVAVIYSPGFGAGWSSWNKDHEEFLCMDKELAELVESGCTEKVLERAEKECGEFAYLNASGLTLGWVDEGQLFEIREYDGNESLCVVGEMQYMQA